jgi:hypothetical protein
MKKFKLFFVSLLFLSCNVVGELRYPDFYESNVYEYLKENNKIYLIKDEITNSSTSYGQVDFKKDLFSSLFEDGSFVIYMNDKFLNKKCIDMFQFYHIKNCHDINYQKITNILTSYKDFTFYEYSYYFDYFVFYHELSHLIILKESDYKHASDLEFLADLMALDLLSYHHGVDFRKNLYLIRKNQFYFKSDLSSGKYNKYLKYKLNDNVLKNSKTVDWFRSVVKFNDENILSDAEKGEMEKELKKINEIIVSLIFKKESIINDGSVANYYKYLNIKMNTDNYFINLL